MSSKKSRQKKTRSLKNANSALTTPETVAEETSLLAEAKVEELTTPELLSAEISEVEPTDKKKKASKTKVIRDSFSFPDFDYRKISELKKTCLAAGIPVKKGEILRAGLNLLTELSVDELSQVMQKVEKVKTGRPQQSL